MDPGSSQDSTPPVVSELSEEIDDLQIQERDMARNAALVEKVRDELEFTQTQHHFLDQHLRYARSLSVSVKAQLPSTHVVSDEALRDAIDAVMEEADDYTDFVTDFITLIMSGAEKMDYLFKLVKQLRDQGQRAANRVRKEHLAWAPEDLKIPLDAVDAELNSINRFMEEDIAGCMKKLQTQRASKMNRLMNCINGSKQLKASMQDTLKEEEQRKLHCEFELLTLKSEVARLKAEKMRTELNMNTMEKRLQTRTARKEDFEKQKDDILHQTEEELVSFLRKAGEESGDIDALDAFSEADEHLKECRKSVIKVLKESVAIEHKTTLTALEATEKQHFVLMVPTSTNRVLTQVVQHVGAARHNASGRVQEDAVSVVHYSDKNASNTCFCSTWSRALLTEEPADSGGYLEKVTKKAKKALLRESSTFSNAWAAALKAVQLSATRQKTVLVFIANEDPSDSDLAHAVRHAEDVFAKASENGTCEAYFLLLGGGGKREMKLQQLVKAANGGRVSFATEKETHKFCMMAGPEDVEDCCENLACFVNPATMRMRIQNQQANDKLDDLQQLQRKVWRDTENQRKRILASHAERAKRNSARHTDKKELLSQQVAELEKYYEGIIDKLAADNDALKRGVEGATSSVEKMELEISKLQKTIEVKQESFTEMEKALATDTSETLAQQQQNRKTLREKCGGFDTGKLGDVLTEAVQHMQDGQVLFRNVLDSFNMTAKPVATVVQSLKLNNGRNLDNVTAAFKVIDYYRTKGSLDMGLAGSDKPANWAKIVEHICGSTREDADVFAGIMDLEDFCFSVGSLDPEARDGKLRELKQKLDDGLPDALDREELKTLKREREEEEETQATLKKRRKSIEEQVTRASEDDRGELKAELRETGKEFVKAGDVVRKTENAIKKELDKPENARVRAMVKKVSAGVGAVYEAVRLEVGMGDAEYGLENLVTTFDQFVQHYNFQVKHLAMSFMKAEVSLTINPERSREHRQLTLMGTP